MHFVFRTLLAFSIGLLLICGCTSQEEGSNLVTGSAPQFALKDLEGNTLRLEDLRGKVVLLNFFATWCGPCRQEIPDFVRLYGKYKDKELEIIGISLDMDGAAVLGPFVQRYGITYPIVLGTRKVVEDYGGVKGIPTSFLIDRKGSITQRFIGSRPAHVFEASLLEVLSELK